MFCETYEHPLKDAAIRGELPAALRGHLDACSSCRAAFAEEQSLYDAIDSALLAAANAEVPATLVPRVRVALNNEPIYRRAPRFWLLTAAPLLAACLLVFIHWRPQSTSSPTATPQNRPNGGAVPSPAISSGVNSLPPSGVIKVQRDRTSSAVRNHPSDAKFVEVIVPPQEAAAFLRYEASLRERPEPKSQTLVAKAIELPAGIQPLEIAEMEVGDLTIPALAKAEADADKK